MLKPFDKLLVNQVREELHAQGIYDTDKVRKCLDKELNDILKGAQRVRTLLLENPLQSLKGFNLQSYSILDCEPLHDMKGHLHNLFEVLPEVLDETTASAFPKS